MTKKEKITKQKKPKNKEDDEQRNQKKMKTKRKKQQRNDSEKETQITTPQINKKLRVFFCSLF